MRNNLVQISESIVKCWSDNFDRFGKMEEKEIAVFDNVANFKDVFEYILLNHAYSIEFILLKFFKEWNNYSLKEWEKLFKKLIYSPKKPAFSLDVFLLFFYQYVKIDFTHTIALSNDMDTEFKKSILADYIERPGRLYLEEDERLKRLADYNLTPENLDKVQIRLLEEGAIVAEPIEYHSHAYQKYGIELFAVQGPPPKSWTWIELL